MAVESCAIQLTVASAVDFRNLDYQGANVATTDVSQAPLEVDGVNPAVLASEGERVETIKDTGSFFMDRAAQLEQSYRDVGIPDE